MSDQKRSSLICSRVATLDTHGDRMSQAIFNPDGRSLVTYSVGGTLRL